MNLNLLKFGVEKFATKNVFSNIQEYVKDKEKFGQDISAGEAVGFFAGITLFIIILGIVMFVLAWIAVDKIVPGTSENSRNTKLIMRIALFFTGGSLSIFYVIMWIFGVKLGS
jgi:hypothetical protein